MLRRTLNLGIVAHVDAGKTTLTERLLHAAGVIDEVGSVDKGTTQTDSLPLEQQRGITIRAAVVSFELGDLTVNLIDTPGHPDFIAEVERALSVLDGAVLVISAVEGVQPQTRVLMRALRRLGIPTMLFVNKLDRVGADFDRVVREIRDRLTPAVAVPDDPDGLVELLTANDDELLAAYVDGVLTEERVRTALAAQAQGALVHPVLRGSAITGAGVAAVGAALGVVPRGVAQDQQHLHDVRRSEVPATVIACEFPSSMLTEMVAGGHPFVAELGRIRQVDYVDLPTGHWPQFTRPAELGAAILAAVDRTPGS